ncbi:CRR6 family NdhI maturation factor [Cyanobium gracile]|uniref:CRR6 family NdhI maturation factor n=1 Tax=Cyanobium gracile UHCC 0281 TaxID=3110309 RepID=A0ABU5SWG4_9CYAN|nr:CRR6 family NdhI maturation factor [Cyanobium gracile]MEA5442860.1 CRR6 family NdhI maturation factor [Cyanobium gracile UHCC 0281]
MALPPCSEPLKVSADQVRGLDLSPLAGLASLAPAALLTASSGLQIDFDWPRDADDPRELSEIAELRLWSLRADALHPWLPLVLERSGGQLTRHVAMLLPHGFSPTEGIRFAPESLELWITQRLFLLDNWAATGGIECRANLGQMAAVLGYELDPGFWSVIP